MLANNTVEKDKTQLNNTQLTTDTAANYSQLVVYTHEDETFDAYRKVNGEEERMHCQ